ncbi:MAG: hypothetical protein K6G83_13610 [Lachnospiraceae bacterium]|nr:hypothetical protein [Lachnospiraceae bacterium]
MNEKSELINSLKCLYNSLLGIEEICAHKDALIASIGNYQTEIQNEKRRGRNSGTMTDLAKTGASAGKIIGIVATVIILLILYGIVGLIMGLMGASITAVRIFGFVLVLIGAGIIYLILKGTNALSNKSVQKSRNANLTMQNNISNYQAQIQDIQERQIPETEARIIIAYQDSQELIESFPPDYRYSDAVGRVIFYLENQRADTLKEALNMYENEVYQNKMLAEQQKQTQAAQISAKANMISAAANVVTAFNTGQIAANTSQMVGSLRNIEGYSAQTAANTAAAASNSARAANSAAQMADYAHTIKTNLFGGF